MSYLTLQDLKTPRISRESIVLGTTSRESVGYPCMSWAAGAGGSAVWPSANLAIYVPLELGVSFLVRKLWVTAGAVGTDHVDVGIYRENGTRIVSAGDTAASGANVGQEFDIADTLLPAPARYYLGMACNGVTFAPFRLNIASAPLVQGLGVMQQATAFALPATATFATNTTWSFVPAFGIAGRTLVV